MDSIREWGYSLCAAAIACGIIQILIPNAGAGKVMRMTVSVFFLCCLFSPFVLQMPELEPVPFSSAQQKAEEIASQLNQNQEEQTLLHAEKELCSQTEEYLKEIGIFSSKIEISIHAVDKSRIEISEVKVILKESDRNREEEAVQQIEDLLGKKPEIQYEGDEKTQ